MSCDQAKNAAVGSCTTRRRNAHGTDAREVVYRWHPWAECQVHIHGIVERASSNIFRCGAVKSLVETKTATHWRGKTTCETRYFISSAVLSRERAAEAIRAHWGIESVHWVLDVIFKEDQSWLRRGYGAQNMALVRRLAYNIVRAGRGNKSIKIARKAAGWNPAFLTSLLQPQIR